MVAGVAGGVARRFGIDPTLVRIAFVLATVGGGTGMVAYLVCWLLVPAEGQETSIAQEAAHDPRALVLAAGLVSIVVASVLVLAALGLGFVTGLVWPLALAAAGVAVIWRHSDDDERAALRRVADRLPGLEEFGVRSRRVAILRVVAGVLLVGAGVGGFLAGHRSAAALRQGAAAAAGIVAGCLLVFGPFWLRLVRQLAEERRERVRSDERAGMAAHLHDSVLQTLALIQRRAGDPREVTRLARAQERELRAWLIEGRGPATLDGEGPPTVAAAVTAVERDVEADHKVAVEAVTVGDCPLDDDLAALVAAGREAAVNAAKWSGAETVSLFAEVEPDAVSLFVRDKGAGFDPEKVGADRRGIAESIRGRISRRGGTVVIRSRPGKGTEVELTMPRRNGRR